MKSCLHKWPALLLAMILILTSCTTGSFGITSPDSLPKDEVVQRFWSPVRGEDPVSVTQGNWQMELDPASGDFTVTNTATGALWSSNPVGRETAEGVNALGKIQLDSQMLISVYTESSATESIYASSTASVKKGGLNVLTCDNGIRCEYTFVSEGITVPVEYTLNEGGLEAAVITNEIEETGDKFLATVSLLPYFAAVEQNAAGWLLVPDGSGALLELTEGTDAYGTLSYKKYVYGVDSLLSLKQATTKEEEILIPAFGSQSGGQGLLGLVVKGEAVTTLQIYGEGNKSGYSAIFPSVVYRESDTLTLYKGTGQEKTVFAYENTPITLAAWRVQYFFCENTDYADMADRVAHYYREQWNLKDRQDSNGTIYLRALGGVEISMHILGVPVDKAIAATTFFQAATWLDTLQGEGVTAVKLLYDGFFQGGVQNAYPLSGKTESALGSKKDRDVLLGKTTETVKIIPMADLKRIYKNSGGISKKNYAARGVYGTFVELYPLQYSTGTPLQTKNSYTLLSPSLLPSVYTQFTANLANLGVTSLCDTGVSALSGDYRRNFSNDSGDIVHLDRQQALQYQQLALSENLTDLDWYTETAHAYMLPYLSGITNLPVKSSRYTGMKDIPFVQLVFGQFTEYALPVVNRHPDKNEYVLKMLEYGAVPSISLMQAQAEDLADSDIEINAGTFDDWKDTVVELSDVACEVYGKLDGVMIGHEECAEGVYRSDYSGGDSLYVNYNDQPVSVGDIVVPAGSYYVQIGG